MSPDKNASDVLILFLFFLDDRQIYRTLSMSATWCKFDVENKGKTFHPNVFVL